MKTVLQILKTKPDRSVHTIAPTASVCDAAELMTRHNLGALLVLDGERLVGIVTERDYARKMMLADRSPRDTPVRDIMVAPVQYVNPEQTNEECMALMTERRVRHLVVIDAGQLVGLISIGDVVKATISEQHFVIEQLEHYIAGDRG